MDLQVLIVGGGAHGVGLLHDLATRRVRGVHLVESSLLSSGTSCKSTKLAHGGLRYLEHFHQWGLVREALQERGILLRALRGLVSPLPFILPVYPGGRPAWMLRSGLFLYDLLAGDGGLPKATSISLDEVFRLAPYLNPDKYSAKKTFLYYDAQMSDDAIVRVAAHASLKLGATFEENAKVTAVEPRSHGGFNATIVQKDGGKKTVTAKYVVNAAGAWCNANLLSWGLLPGYGTLLNVGSHLVFSGNAVDGQTEHCAATMLQNSDGRVVFFIPWQNNWLMGTTESALTQGSPEAIKVPPQDVLYLTDIAERYLKLKDPLSNCIEQFAGVRTMPLSAPAVSTLQQAWLQEPFKSPFYVTDAHTNLSVLSRETIIDEKHTGLITIYGGKYTTYRSQAEKLGSLLCERLQCGGTSATADSRSWFLEELYAECPGIFESSKELRNMM